MEERTKGRVWRGVTTDKVLMIHLGKCHKEIMSTEAGKGIKNHV